VNEIQEFRNSVSTELVEAGFDEVQPEQRALHLERNRHVARGERLVERGNETQKIRPIDSYAVCHIGRRQPFVAVGDDGSCQPPDPIGLLSQRQTAIRDNRRTTELQTYCHVSTGGMKRIRVNSASQRLGSFTIFGMDAAEISLTQEYAGAIGLMCEPVLLAPRRPRVRFK